MSALDAFLIMLAVLALLGVIFEEVIHINKAKGWGGVARNSNYRCPFRRKSYLLD